ncbi:hypothetical protein BOTBODRAFT_40112 [Botryobasidium botryosum FD-172 SS1]|uniref:Uncharacterized protein n=1 Tax=Botryobasidium botryosum (strain FD-172 SS1) TaxID=930990 RepID=A0A067NBU0_BOTB1|nr:hypothetical protein BOTBODRAFT_40112 [Botryobasidium botryosum FD-172 SS1]
MSVGGAIGTRTGVELLDGRVSRLWRGADGAQFGPVYKSDGGNRAKQRFIKNWGAEGEYKRALFGDGWESANLVTFVTWGLCLAQWAVLDNKHTDELGCLAALRRSILAVVRAGISAVEEDLEPRGDDDDDDGAGDNHLALVFAARCSPRPVTAAVPLALLEARPGSLCTLPSCPPSPRQFSPAPSPPTLALSLVPSPALFALAPAPIASSATHSPLLRSAALRIRSSPNHRPGLPRTPSRSERMLRATLERDRAYSPSSAYDELPTEPVYHPPPLGRMRGDSCSSIMVTAGSPNAQRMLSKERRRAVSSSPYPSPPTMTRAQTAPSTPPRLPGGSPTAGHRIHCDLPPEHLLLASHPGQVSSPSTYTSKARAAAQAHAEEILRQRLEGVLSSSVSSSTHVRDPSEPTYSPKRPTPPPETRSYDSADWTWAHVPTPYSSQSQSQMSSPLSRAGKPLSEPITPPPSPPFDARSASLMLRDREGYVSFSDVAGLGGPCMDDDDALPDAEHAGRWWGILPWKAK